MKASQRNYLRIPRDATFPTLPVPDDFQEYALPYFRGAKQLWEATGKGNAGGVPWPDNLVFPILFLVHHFLELELKSAIELTYFIGSMTGELPEEQDWRKHDLNILLSLLQSNLAKLDEISAGSPAEPTCELIEDIAKFGAFGESLRYPMRTIKATTWKKAVGSDWPDGLIPDVKAVIAAAEKALGDFNGLISLLMVYDDWLTERERSVRSE